MSRTTIANMIAMLGNPEPDRLSSWNIVFFSGFGHAGTAGVETSMSIAC
jgi:hypothetical protein